MHDSPNANSGSNSNLNPKRPENFNISVGGKHFAISISISPSFANALMLTFIAALVYIVDAAQEFTSRN